MARFILAGANFAVNLDYVTNAQINGNNVMLEWDVAAMGGTGSFTIYCSDPTQAAAVLKAVTQPFDPKA